jgi:glycosyltransferase involved in cell wall biosynthesis
LNFVTNSVHRPDVAILLATFCGAEFLAEQLASIERQTYPYWRLYASDDGSPDGTVDILRGFQEKLGANRVQLIRGPGRGFVLNFLSLICNSDIQSNYYAFSDQDDIWDPNKLAIALERLRAIPPDVPGLYCSRTRLIDALGRDVGLSPLFRKPPSFGNALVQNIAGGNTMVFNKAARRYLIQAGGKVDVPSHDWWLYMVITAAGGHVIYDPHCSIQYRRHPNNLVGTNIGIRPRLKRAKMLLQGRFKGWNDRNIEQLRPFRQNMAEENRKIFDRFCQARERSLPMRIISLLRSGVYRQTALGTIGLIVGIALKRI